MGLDWYFLLQSRPAILYLVSFSRVKAKRHKNWLLRLLSDKFYLSTSVQLGLILPTEKSQKLFEFWQILEFQTSLSNLSNYLPIKKYNFFPKSGSRKNIMGSIFYFPAKIGGFKFSDFCGKKNWYWSFLVSRIKPISSQFQNISSFFSINVSNY